MFIKLYKTRALFFVVFAILLCQCTTAVNSPIANAQTISEDSVPDTIATPSPYLLSAKHYLHEAKSQTGSAKQDTLISAAGRLIDDGLWHQGAAILSQTKHLSVEQQAEKNILLAKIDIVRDKPKNALAKLAQISDYANLSSYHQIQFHELLAQAHRATNNYSQALLQRISLEKILPDRASQIKNERRLWLTLSNLPAAELDTMLAEAKNNSLLQGWLQLAFVARNYRTNAKSLMAALDQWQTRFSNHPANNLLPTPLDSIANKLVAPPKQIALLLPLSGTLAGPGKAIKEGFMASYKSNKEADKIKIKIKAYDTNKDAIETIYQQAINDGAEYVVGPLTKNQVATVAALEHPVPTLLLNDTVAASQTNSYRFGLSPIHEAVQVALKARARGYKKALVIAPKNEWGNEVSQAFIKKWQADRGQVTAIFSYAVNEDLNKKMQDVLQITHSQKREKQLKQLLGQDLQTFISRRQDFDMIFLLAYPSKARQIMPLLKYYYAGDIPVYATSSVYSGSANALKDKDLDGIVFCDIPWVFTHQIGVKNWPEQFNSYNRLYALGMDSYALATQLNQLMLFPTDSSKDNGALYLKSTQQVVRVLEWGQFKQGLAHSLG